MPIIDQEIEAFEKAYPDVLDYVAEKIALDVERLIIEELIEQSRKVKEVPYTRTNKRSK